MTRTLDGTKDRTIVLGMRAVPVAPAAVAPPAPPAKASAKAASKVPAKVPAKDAKPPGKRKTDLFLDL
jgi:hypothetical protein